MLFYRIPAPNEALVITGAKGSGTTPFRVATGRGVFVWPWRARARIISLDLRQAELNEPCVTKQGITLGVQAVAVFKVGNDSESITNAATRFLDQQNQVAPTIGRVLAGHLRSIIGNMTVEDIISSRNTLAQEIRAAASDELQKMGLDLDAFQIQEIVDNTGYIDNIAAPHVAAIERDARIAKAQADQSAAEKEQAAAALKAQYVRDTEIKQAGFTAEVEQAKATSAQAGPLAEARASQQVIEQRALLAEKEALLTDKKLESEIRRPADAEAYKTRTIAEGERDKTKFETEAEANRRRTLALADAEAAKAQADGAAYAQRTVAAADADALNLRADALQGDNQALIAANKLVDQLPGLVEAAARGIASSNLTILNGAEGVSQLIAGVASQGLSLYEALRPPQPDQDREQQSAPVTKVTAAARLRAQDTTPAARS